MSSPTGTGVETVAGRLREQLPSGMVVTEPPAIVALVRPWNAQLKGRPSVVARAPPGPALPPRRLGQHDGPG